MREDEGDIYCTADGYEPAHLVFHVIGECACMDLSHRVISLEEEANAQTLDPCGWIAIMRTPSRAYIHVHVIYEVEMPWW